MRKLLLLVCLVASGAAAGAQAPGVRQEPASPLALPRVAPTVDQILSLHRVAAPAISPDGRLVAYTVRSTNWDANLFETQIWLADARTGERRQLTTARGSSFDPIWSPDGTRLAFRSDRSEKPQVYVMNIRGGEGEPLTATEDGVNAFAWSPDGRWIAYTALEPKNATIKEREKKYGEFEIVGQEHRMAHLFLLDLATHTTRQLTSGAFYVGSFSWSPDGRSIAFDERANGDPGSSASADIAVVSVADGAVRKVVTQDGPDAHPVWSPDGTRIAFQSAMANPNFYYTNQVIAVVPAEGGAAQALTSAFDEDAALVAWTPSGIFFAASHRTWSYLYRLDPPSRTVTRLAPADEWIGSSFSIAHDGSAVAFLGADARSLPEIFVAPLTFKSPRKLTDMNAQLASWVTSTLEVVSWRSQDGSTIEGVLHKPADFNPARKYPLLVVIHGGPTGVSRPVPFTSTIYPIDVWVPRGVLVLEPNYRGSAGYGEKFRSLNVRNLGVGDAWDVLSGIDALIAKGVVDPARVGAMGWSQGGYIAAFLATHDSARFKAISVGAGISDWTTYYVNTDITPFTRQYLQATPWDDPEIYAKTSPITYVKQAKTPVLIQHGEADQRVPPPNAHELYRALQDEHVPSKLIVYKGFGGVGHGPTKPKSDRATMDHNLEWFDQYMFQKVARPTSHGQD